MEEAPENGKESLHSAHVSGMIEWMNELYEKTDKLVLNITHNSIMAPFVTFTMSKRHFVFSHMCYSMSVSTGTIAASFLFFISLVLTTGVCYTSLDRKKAQGVCFGDLTGQEWD